MASSSFCSFRHVRSTIYLSLPMTLLGHLSESHGEGCPHDLQPRNRCYRPMAPRSWSSFSQVNGARRVQPERLRHAFEEGSCLRLRVMSLPDASTHTAPTCAILYTARLPRSPLQRKPVSRAHVLAAITPGMGQGDCTS